MQKEQGSSLSPEEIGELRMRLQEAQETLDAIRRGEVDGLVISTPQGEQVYSITNADRPYRTLIEEMNEGAAILSSDDAVLYCNKSFAKIVHTPAEDIVGSKVDASIGRSFAKELGDLLARARARKEAITAEIVFETNDGISVPAYVSANTLQTSTSSNTFLVVTDLSEHRKEEVMRRDLERLVLERTKTLELALESETRTKRQALLLQDILSHDIRNYNQVTKLSAELLKQMVPEDSELQKIADTLLQSVNGSTMLVERAKRLGLVLADKSPKLFPVDLVNRINEAQELVSRAYRTKEIRFSLRIENPEAKPMVLADDLLVEIFDNLYSNSAKYTQAPVVEIETTVDGASEDYVKISVLDRGSGIEDKSRMFTRYLSNAKKGTGLGLSIVYALVSERFGGKIELGDRVEGDHTKGTKAEILLRRAR